VDTIGELAAMYRYAEVAFVGGSLVEHGGQNPLEPAWFAKPAVVGPSMSNFREITATMLAGKAIRQIRSADELPSAVEALLLDHAGAAAMGQRARAILEANRGATSRTVEALVELLSWP
jgi:3-deoxy-D-manno-octulosonic-acid transferase